MITDITNEEEYQAALARIDELMDSEVGTPEGQELNELVEIVVHYEDILCLLKVINEINC